MPLVEKWILGQNPPTYQQAMRETVLSAPLSVSADHAPKNDQLLMEGIYIFPSKGPPCNALYEVSQGMKRGVKEATQIISVVRVDRRLTHYDAKERLELVQNHVFDLQRKRRLSMGGTSIDFAMKCEYSAQKASDSQSIMMEQASFGKGWMVKRGLSLIYQEAQGDRTVNNTLKKQLVLRAVPRMAEGEKTFEWKDAKGETVAMELLAGSAGPPQLRLNITKPLSQEFEDVLVSAWCVRLWNDTFVANRSSTTRSGVSSSRTTLSPLSAMANNLLLKRTVSRQQSPPRPTHTFI
ncbi:MAG: hypothetical protein M1818_002253 [Claussenomyces sp. TS43310]|nr:MAG: hypothetical protein M1818_002253 [Claussenomyces sp. TS43310]